MKTCAECKTPKPEYEFTRRSRNLDGLDNLCRSCKKIKSAENYQKREKHRRAGKKAERDKDGKICRQCGDLKPLDQFNKQGWVCFDCKELNRQANQTKFRAGHRDGLNTYLKEYHKTHKPVRPEGYKEQRRIHENERYRNDPEHRLQKKAYAKTYRQNNQDKIRQYGREWRYNHLEKARAYQREYYREYPSPETHKNYQQQQRIKHQDARLANAAAYRARRNGAPGTFTKEYVKWLFKWQEWQCFYCHKPFNRDRSIDHVVAIDRNGSNRTYNVVLACQKCNSSKQENYWGIEWNPESVESIQSFHSEYATMQFTQALENDGISFHRNHDHIVVGVLRVYLVSTLWAGWAGPQRIQDIRSADPNNIIIFDYEWRRRPNAILNIVKAKAGLYKSVGARRLDFIFPEADEVREFMNEFHVQGFRGGNWYIGLADMSKIYGVASFTFKDDSFELTRMAFKDHVTGGLSRIIKKFGNMFDKAPIHSYCDPRFGDGAGYIAAGFDALDETDMPSYQYANGTGLYHRLFFRKDEMAKKCDFFDETLNERDNAKANGLLRVDGLPQKRFVYHP